jgi:hypothetical protein
MTRNNTDQYRYFLFLLVIATIFHGVFIVLFDGTGDSGDSILHFLIAKSAFERPALLLDHWGKPFFTLLAAPFAQFGFTGMKIFNAACGILAVLFTTSSAQKMEMKFWRWTPLLFWASTLWLPSLFSGFTEPLFACIFSLALWLVIQERFLIAAIVISFLPMVRTEGGLIVLIWILYFMKKKQWKALPLLALGGFLYTVIGVANGKDFLWLLAENPYAEIEGAYGSGSYFHFVRQMPYMLGIPLTVFLVIGLLRLGRSSQQWNIFWMAGFFIFFFVAHSIFWGAGLFNSLGLKRVFIAVFPAMMLLCLHGMDSLLVYWGRWSKVGGLIALVLLLLGFALSESPTSLLLSDFKKTNHQRFMETTADRIEKLNRDTSLPIGYYQAYFALQFENHDYFSNRHHLMLAKRDLQTMKHGTLVIWDNYIAANDFRIRIEDFEDGFKPVFQLVLESDSLFVYQRTE